jgi:transmembrane sensor
MKIPNENKINWDLLGKYLSGESNKEETIQIQRWIESSNKNKILFENIQSDWNKINLVKNMKKVDVDNAWENLKQRILQDEPEIIPIRKLSQNTRAKLYLRRTLQVAASILIFIGISFGIYKIFSDSFISDNTIFKSGSDNTSSIMLPDGSKIYLNSNTIIKYPERFGKDSRNIYLKGEAYFDVVNNPGKPFVVKTNNAVIKVLGTSFNINTKTANNNLEVFVESGNVQLLQKSNNENKILVEPGYIGVLSRNTLIKSKNNDINYLAWKTRYLIFRNTKLGIVAGKLESVYNTSIQFNNREIADCPLTATFNNASLDSILNVIEGTFNIEIEDIIKTNRKVIIVGNGC